MEEKKEKLKKELRDAEILARARGDYDESESE